MVVFRAIFLRTIIPSQVAFTSLVSAGGIPTTSAYDLIALLRLTMTQNDFMGSHFYLGKWRKLFYVATILFSGLVLPTQIYFPVNAQIHDFACAIFGIVSWYFYPENKRLRREQVLQALRTTSEPLHPVSSLAENNYGIRHRKSTKYWWEGCRWNVSMWCSRVHLRYMEHRQLGRQVGHLASEQQPLIPNDSTITIKRSKHLITREYSAKGLREYQPL
ncbi:hypothetical protein OBBRIDRAFT_828859 [Obba rivulosa]|uniref:Uncharacterized protein n=1 Tax=Obba rivulosa TaxID=1052685 RepID=A0A8E2AUF5_9APHY|nr:hypothetical protein OBBRIDRAFT_828859 [Obba rivulosa]